MRLTGKALADYQTFIYNNYPNNLISENCGYGYGMFERDLEQLLWIIPETCQNALIIEFFDSVGIYIFSDNLTNCSKYGVYLWNAYVKRNYKNKKKVAKWEDSRTEATNKAIIKANELYNSENK